MRFCQLRCQSTQWDATMTTTSTPTTTTGNIHKLGRLVSHEWWTVTDREGKTKERYLFLFKSRFLVCKVRRISEDRSVFVLKDVIKVHIDIPHSPKMNHFSSLLIRVNFDWFSRMQSNENSCPKLKFVTVQTIAPVSKCMPKLTIRIHRCH